MARLVSQSKKGFYPYPLDKIRDVVKWLEVPHPDRVTLLDPCAGEGTALLDLASQLQVPVENLYVNELDEERAAECSRAGLVHVLNGDALTEISYGGRFSLLWPNPPYDRSFGSRLEAQFLSLGRTLPFGGVLAFIVPFKVLFGSDFEKFPREFKQIRILKFPEGGDTYGQCVVLAYKRQGDTVGEQDNWRRQLYSPLTLGCEPDIRFRVPSLPLIPESAFYSKRISEEEFARLLTLKEVRAAHQFKYPKANSQISTLMPLRSGHQAVTLATGALDGVYLEPESGNTLVLLGKTEIVEKPVEKEGAEDSDRKVRIMPRPQIIAWNLTESVQNNEARIYTIE